MTASAAPPSTGSRRGGRRRLALPLVAALSLGVVSVSPGGAGQRQLRESGSDSEYMVRQQADTDRTWRAASEGFMQMEKITYRSKAGDLDIPAFVFQPLHLRGPKGHSALVWVHEGIRGHLGENYIPYIREATSRGYVVIAPEYRGGIGYGKAFYDAIDYGGREVDDVVTAVSVLTTGYPHVDPARIGVIGWSHGGMITLLSITRNQTMFKAAAAIVPVTNLFQRLAWKGVEYQHVIDPHEPPGRLAVREAPDLQRPFSAVRRRQAADSVARPCRQKRRRREHRGGHAAGGRASLAQAASGGDQGLRPPARRSRLRPPRRPRHVAAREYARPARLVEPGLGVSGSESRSVARRRRRADLGAAALTVD